MMQFMDGCEHYQTAAQMLTKWNASIPTVTPTTSGRNGRGLSLVGGGVEKSLTHQNGWVFGWAVNVQGGTFGFGSDYFYQGSHAGETALFSIYGETDGSISLYAGNGRHNLIQNSGSLGKFLKPGIWYWFDCKYAISGSTNMGITATFRVNTEIWATGSANTDINVNSLLLQVATTNYHSFRAAGTNALFDDFAVADMSGLGSVNDFFGDVAIGALFPDADDHIDWSLFPLGSPNSFSLVNSQFPDDDTTYINSSTVGNVDNFGWQPTVVPPGGSIVAVHYGVYARKDAEGSRSFVTLIGPTGSPAFTSNPWFVGDTYAYYFQAFDQDPQTGIPWTQTGFNGTKFGVKLNS